MNPSKLTQKFQEHELVLPDGSDVWGWYFQAKAKNPKGVILFFHGNGQNRSAHFLSMFWVLENGYDLAVFDYPGYGISEGKPTPKNTVDMGIAAIQYVHNLNPQLPLIVYGQSLGGNVAMRSVYEMKDKVKPEALVVDSSFLSYKDAARGILAGSAWTWPFQNLTSLLLSDEWAIDDRISSLSEIPMVVIHSKKDELVSIKLGEEIFFKSQSPKVFIQRQNSSHNETFSGPEGSKLKAKLLDTLGRLTNDTKTETLSLSKKTVQ